MNELGRWRARLGPAFLCAAGLGMLGLAACGPAKRTEAQQNSAAGLPNHTPTPSVAGDGPFGIAEGTPIANVAGTTADGDSPGYYRTNHVPIPYPGIEFYSVRASPSIGTCMIKAVSDDISSDSAGNAVKSAVDNVRDDLEVRYGKPEVMDFLQPGSIWKDYQDWMMGVYKKERVYGYLWKRPANADIKTWRGVDQVGVFAESDGSKGWYWIEYDFDNNNKCDQATKTQSTKAL